MILVVFLFWQWHILGIVLTPSLIVRTIELFLIMPALWLYLWGDYTRMHMEKRRLLIPHDD